MLTLPIYAAHGSDDRCTSLPAVKALLAAVQSRDKTLNELPGAYHELLTGPEAPECAAKLVSWLAEQQQQQQRAAAAPASGALSTTEPSRL